MQTDAASRLAAVTMVGLPHEGLTPAFRKTFAARPFAGVLLFRRHFGTLGRLVALVEELRALAAPRTILVAMDEEGGFVSQLAPELPVPPAARVLGRGASETEIERIGAAVGGWLSAAGVDVDFAPVLDVDAESRNPVIGPRSFGRDPADVARLGAAMLRGLREGGVLACTKHFPGHGSTVTDSHLALPECGDDRATIGARDLVPFRETHALSPLVMTAHVRYPALDPQWPATLSPAIVRGLLRETLGMRGVVVTDAMEMAGVAGAAPGGEGPLRALAAGCDLLLFGAWTAGTEATLDEAARTWTTQGEDALPLARWEAARGAIEALYSAALGAERSDRGASASGAARASYRTLFDPGNIAALVPPGWDAMLDAICRRALSWIGPPAAVALDRLEVLEPSWSGGPSIAELLVEHGVPARARAFAAAAAGAAPGHTADVADDFAALRRLATGATGAGATDAPDPLLVALPRRTPLSPADEHELRALCIARPTVLVALEQDAFLTDFPEAAGRLSACDATPAMRRAVAAEIAGAMSRVS
ncbi:MAG: glycoside hydrolase family 3 N-terminal domain-containing protein [Candidatus Eisenbacteria bacterium]